MALSIYLNGRYLDSKEEALVPLHEHALLYGDGIFEGIRAYNRRVFRMKDHMDRLWRSAHSIRLEIPATREELDAILIETVRRTGLDDAYIRLIVSRGPGDMGIDPRKCSKGAIYVIAGGIQLYPAEKYRTGLRTVIAATRRTSPDSLNPSIKSLNYLNNIMGKLEAIQGGVDEAIMLNAQGQVTEGTADNLFLARDGGLCTPPVYVGILEGITRKVVFEICAEEGIACSEQILVPHDLYNAEEIFLCGTGAEIIPVVEVAGRKIGDGKPGALFHRLQWIFKERTLVDGVPFKKPISAARPRPAETKVPTERRSGTRG